MNNEEELFFEEFEEFVDSEAAVTELVLFFAGHFGKGFSGALWLEDGVPAEAVVPSGRDDCARKLADEEVVFSGRGTVADGGLGGGVEVVEGGGEFVKAFDADSFEEPFDQGTGEAVEGFEGKRYIVDDEGFGGVLAGGLKFEFADFLGIDVLDFGHVDIKLLDVWD